jgi:cell division protein FtsW
MPENGVKGKPCDFLYAALVAALLIFGIVMVFSASSYSALRYYDDSYYFFKREMAFAAVGLFFLVAAAFAPMKLIYRMTPPIALASLGLLLALYTPLASARHGAARWIEVGGFTVMPGEIAKFAAILFVARFLSREPDRIRSLFKGVIPLLAYCGLNFLLIYKQPSLSTAITLAGIVLGVMFIAGMNLMYVGAALGAAAMGVFYMIMSDKDGYHFQRITGFLDPFAQSSDEGWQVAHSLLGFGAGGVLGVGLGNSIQKALYLPEGHNDFILSIIGEELGFLGCLLLLAVYLALIFRGAWIAIKAPDRFSMLVAAGITVMFALQVIMNVLVVTAWMPPTGVVLPFISYGGNSLILYMAMAGVMLNISRRIKDEPAAGEIPEEGMERARKAPERLTVPPRKLRVVGGKR